MKSNKKKIIVSIAIVCFIAAALLGTRIYILNKFKTTLCQKLEALNEVHLTAKYDSAYVKWYDNIIVIDQLVISKDTQGTNCSRPEFITVKQLKITGIRLWDLAFNKEINIDEVIINRPHVILQEHSPLSFSKGSKESNKLKLSISRLLLTSSQVDYMDSASCELKREFNTNITTSGLTFELQPGKPFMFGVNTITLDSSSIKFPKQLYAFQIKKALINVSDSTLNIDSFRIIPQASKNEFTRKLGHSADRIEGIIPFVRLSGLSYQYQDTFALQAKHTSMQLFIKVFRDKQLPRKGKYIPLPLHYLQGLPFGLCMDTLEVIKSYVSYEELPAGAKTPGLVFFDNIKAAITSINNAKQLKGETRLIAQSDFMGQGKLNINTVFPWQLNRNCSMQGTLQNFNLLKANNMFKAIQNMQFESGIINNLAFNFAYNETRADGEIALNYHNLRVIIFKKDNEDGKHGKQKRGNSKGAKENKTKTFVINEFIINKGENADSGQRTGKILYYHDTGTSIFNYWWKSVLSGLKSSFGIDKAAITPKKK